MRQSSQTSQASPASHVGTEHRGLRDADRWKDKIELRLDNRQVAFLFFGSALIACLLFILGVIVGKRLESRGHAMAPQIEDPLALLDRVASTVPPAPLPRSQGEVAISRAQATAAPRSGRPVTERKGAEARTVAQHDEGGTEVFAAAGKPAKQGAGVVAPPPSSAPALKAAPVAIRPAVKPATTREIVALARATNPEILPPSTLPPSTLPQAPAARARAAPPSAVRGKPSEVAPVTPPPVAALPAGNAGLTALNAAVGPGGAKPAVAARARFMLQVGSFADRAEAEAFASSFSAERPLVVTSELPGKGTWFRVRVGSFGAFKDAVDAKLAFERRYNKIALVVGPL